MRTHDGCGVLDMSSPILSTGLLDRLVKLVAELSAATRPLVLSSSHPRIFLAGADLHEIAGLSAVSSRDYARRGRHLLALIGTFPAPVVAAVHGACTGGGLDLVLACDAVVASDSATFAHPGVRRGLVTGWGGTERFPSRAGTAEARRLFLEGRPIPAPVAASRDWVVRAQGADPLPAACAEARRLAALDSRRLELWRAVRDARFVDRFRASVVHNEGMQ